MDDIFIDETITIIEKNFLKEIKDFILEKPDISIMVAALIVIPIGLIVKIKLDKMNESNNNFFPSVEKYEKLFKVRKNAFNEATKPKNSNVKGW